MKETSVFKSFIQISFLKYFSGSLDSLRANSEYTITMDYPLDEPVTFKIVTGKKGLTPGNLLKKIGMLYRKIYQNSDKYKVYGHALEDLILEAIRINHKTKQITLSLGS